MMGDGGSGMMSDVWVVWFTVVVYGDLSWSFEGLCWTFWADEGAKA